MPLQLQVTGELTREDVTRLVNPFVTAIAKDERLLLDLSRVTWAQPFSLITLAALLDHFHAMADGLRIVVPDSNDCRMYLTASGFLQGVPSTAEIVGGESLRLRAPSGADTVLAITRLDREADITAARETVEGRLDEMLGTGSEQWTRTKGAVLNTLGELCANIFQHAAYPVGWVGAQRYRSQYQEHPWVVIGIADAGRGIRRSLATAYPEMATLSDGRVVQQALDQELSRLTTPDHTRGAGFRVLKKATAEHDGSFYLRSGTGAVERRRRQQSLELNEDLESWPGTQLEVVISCG